jgi:hypothetical protein
MMQPLGYKPLAGTAPTSDRLSSPHPDYLCMLRPGLPPGRDSPVVLGVAGLYLWVYLKLKGQDPIPTERIALAERNGMMSFFSGCGLITLRLVWARLTR